MAVALVLPVFTLGILVKVETVTFMEPFLRPRLSVVLVVFEGIFVDSWVVG